MQVAYKDGTDGFKPYQDTGNWVCHPPEDYKALMEWIKRELERDAIQNR